MSQIVDGPAPRSVDPKIIGGPGQYIQGAGVLDRLGDYLSTLGEKALILANDVVWSLLGKRITAGVAGKKIEIKRAAFGTECCHSEIERARAACKESDSDVIVGLGGGKTLDTAKAVTLTRNLPLVIAPTIASNDAPTSRVIVVYTEEGALKEVFRMPASSSIVLVDTEVIVGAPVRFFVAGMGDALATKFEAEQNILTKSLNLFQGRQTNASLVLADACYNLIRKYGVSARNAVAQRLVTEAVEAVVEANIYHSGVGFESGGLAAAHSLTRGFSVIEEMHGSLHGEEVAFGLLVQLVLENRSQEFIDDLIKFYRSVGLPCSLADLGLKEPTDHHLHIIAERSCAEGSHINKMTIPVDEKTLIDAIYMADLLGKNQGPVN